jgi:hypothetical protein
MIVKRGEAIGLDWEGTMAKRRQHNWPVELKAVVNNGVTYPEYYTQPFHAYEQVGRAAGHVSCALPWLRSDQV